MISKRSGGKRCEGDCQHHLHYHHHFHRNHEIGREELRRRLASAAPLPELVSSDISPEDIKRIEAGLIGTESSLQHDAARRIRELLSSHRDALIREVLHHNWIPRLLGWLKLHDSPTLQVESLWALTNIAAAASEHTPVLMKHGIVPILINLLDSRNEEVLEQAIWVLGNLAGEGSATRDAILNASVLVPLVTVLKERKKLSLRRIGTWTLSNLCDGQPRPVFDINLVLPILAELLKETDTEVLSHVCWALSHLCDGPSSHIQYVVNQEVCWKLVELLMYKSWRVTKPALRTIGNIVCAEDDHDYTQHIIDCGAVPCLRQLISHSNREIQKEACWTLSNIAAGTVDQIQCVLDSNSIPQLVQLASDPSSDSEVKSEACWVVLNATSCGSDGQIEYLVRQGCIDVLGDLLSESSMVMMALEGLERILQVGEEVGKRLNGANPYAAMLATSKIEELETHKSAAVAKRASRIWKQHFVTCAICSRAFSKHSPETFFCEECKCHVCRGCNCTVFHLEYQESFWKGETEKEEVMKVAKQTTKRNKRQKKKKKQKQKQKKVVTKQEEDGGAADKGSPDSADEDDDEEDKDDSSEEEILTPAVPLEVELVFPASKRRGGSQLHHVAFENGTSTGEIHLGKLSPTEPASGSMKSHNVANGHRMPDVSTLTKDSANAWNGKPRGAAAVSQVGSNKRGNKTLPAAFSDFKIEDPFDANDELVSFLEQTGSILALASKLDEEDSLLMRGARQ